MPASSAIRDALRKAVSLFLPAFARADDFMGKGRLRWLAHGAALTSALLFVAALGQLIPFERAAEAARLTPRWGWLPFFFLFCYLLSWLGWWFSDYVRRNPAAWPHLDLERRWEWILQFMARKMVPLQGETPVYLVLGKPHGGYAALFQSAEGPWAPRPEEQPGDGPLYAFLGGPDGCSAIYLCWDGEHSRAETGAAVDATGGLLAAVSRTDRARPLDAFRHFCALLRRVRADRIPVNGVLTFVPHQVVTASQGRRVAPTAFWSPELEAVRDVLQIQCTCWTAFDMGGRDDFRGLIEREYARANQRIPERGRQVSFICEANTPADAAVLPPTREIEQALRVFFRESFPTRVHVLLSPSVEGDEDIRYSAEESLFQVALEWQKGWPEMAESYLKAATLLRDDDDAAAAGRNGVKFFTGCALASCSDVPEDRAHRASIRRLLERMHLYRNQVAWRKKALGRFAAERRMTIMGYVSLVGATLALCSLAWWLYL